MTAINGTWQLTKVDGFLAFFEEIGSPEEYKAKVRALGPLLKENPGIYQEKFTYDGSNIHLIVTINGKVDRDVTIPVGPEADIISTDGRPVKIKITIESDTKAIFQEKGAGFEFTGNFEISGGNLTVTSKGGSKTAVMVFKKI